MKPKITGKKKKGSAAGASSGKRHAPGPGEKRRRETKSAADDMFMSVPSFENDGKELDLGGSDPAWKTYDWQGEISAREKKREGGAGAGNARAAANAGRAEKKRSKEPVVNRVKPPRPEKKVKVDMRFGSEADKKKLADQRFDERREAKRQKYAALSAAAAEHDGAGANEDEPGVSGKVLGRRRSAAEKRARAAEKRRADRLEKGLPVTQPLKRLPAKLALGTAAGVSALAKGDDDSGSKSKNAKRAARREKARTARDAEEAKAQVTPGGVPENTAAATRVNTEAAVRENPSAKGAPEESAKARARREKREAAEALERRAAALREAAEADSDSDSEADGSEGASSSEDAGEGGDWGEAFSSDEDDGEVDSDEDAALDAAFAESDDDDAEEGASSSEEGGSGGEEDSEEEKDEARGSGQHPASARDPPKKPSLVDKMRAKLSGGQFRMLNEALYTTTGDKALRMVEDQPGMFSAYHAGFREQTKEWPVRPVDACLKWLATQPQTLRVADFGCGDAELAARAPQKTVHSFDLESEAKGVVACNMANVPLEDASVEVAVFSLSLMGTDYGSFMEEAHRVRRARLTDGFFPASFPSLPSKPALGRASVFARPSIHDGRVFFTRARTHGRTLPFHRRVITMSPPAGRSPDTRRSPPFPPAPAPSRDKRVGLTRRLSRRFRRFFRRCSRRGACAGSRRCAAVSTARRAWRQSSPSSPPPPSWGSSCRGPWTSGTKCSSCSAWSSPARSPRGACGGLRSRRARTNAGERRRERVSCRVGFAPRKRGVS